MVHIYGISNCDTTKKALTWLRDHKVAYTFHDYKKEGASQALLKKWLMAGHGNLLLNKKGTTWKALSPRRQEEAGTLPGQIKLMSENTSLIKRPVADLSGIILIGFNDITYQKEFSEQ